MCMDVCLPFIYVFICLLRGFRMAWTLLRLVLPKCQKRRQQEALGHVSIKRDRRNLRSFHLSYSVKCYICSSKSIKMYKTLNTFLSIYKYWYFLSLLFHRVSCRFTKYHIISKCTNCMSFILNHFFKTLSLLLHVSIAYRLSSSGSTTYTNTGYAATKIL